MERRAGAVRIILIVDYDAAAAAGFADQLEPARFETIIASDGTHALTILAREPVEAILLDLLMPGMNGWELLDIRRGDPRLRRIPVVVTSALADGVDGGDLLPWDAVLPRPFDHRALEATLERCFAHTARVDDP